MEFALPLIDLAFSIGKIDHGGLLDCHPDSITQIDCRQNPDDAKSPLTHELSAN
jgi:hypothetical protein